MNSNISSNKVIFLFLLCASLAVGCGDDDSVTDTGAGDTSVDDTSVDVGDDTGEDTSPPPELCSEEGAMRVVACGSCGTGQETCTAGAWTRSSECIGEGECSPGTVETDDAMCGSRSRICSTECSFGEWDVTTPPGECAAGDTRASDCDLSSAGTDTCSDDCMWEAGECEGLCGELRSSPPDSVEVCVPAGEYLRFNEDFTEMATITLSAYAMDKYPVTWRRYVECVDAGGCEDVPEDVRGLFDAVGPTNLARGMNLDYGTAFCEWDGGRAVPTLAQVEMAIRGPAPSRQLYPWGDEPSCEAFSASRTCSEPLGSDGRRVPFDEYEGIPSPFGVTGLGYGGGTLLRDTALGVYLADASDPHGVGDGSANFYFVGDPPGAPAPVGGADVIRERVATRSFSLGDGFHCVREL